jgi:hypothetical protein
MRSIAMPAVLAGFALLPAFQPVYASPCSLAGLQWMAGTWRDTEEANVLTEERWVVAPNDRLVGSSWRLHSDTDGGVIESMIVVMENGAPTMRIRHFDSTLAHAREEKDAPMLFVASKCDDKTAVLDGTGSQQGEHFTYSRAGDVLTFVGDFIHGGKPVRAEAHFSLLK